MSTSIHIYQFREKIIKATKVNLLDFCFFIICPNWNLSDLNDLMVFHVIERAVSTKQYIDNKHYGLLRFTRNGADVKLG
ncbi:MAG: hypothetical protein LBC68_05420 [Prevotellaceae bacterium]|jgi:hypothetical protein|nr:hypothetical protein [Prevotellaceae bacterium]